MREKISYWWETGYPYALSLLFGCLLYRLPFELPTIIDARGFVPSAFYAAIFNINIFGAGVIISVFVFTQAPATGFIGKIDKLNLYRRFRRYLKESVVFGLAAGIACIPLSAATPKAMTIPLMSACAVVALSLTACFIMLSWRVSRIFLYWVSKN